MISSTSNQQVKNIVALKKKARERRQQSLFIVEGIRMFSETAPEDIEKVYMSASFAAELENLKHVKAVAADRYEILSDSVFQYVSDTQTPQGILCLVKMKKQKLEEFISQGSSFLILENIQDPGNLGTMFRTAEGAGISGIIMDQNTVDIYNPKVIRSTMGSIYRIPFFISDDLHKTIREMKAEGVNVYAAYLDGRKYYDQYDYTGKTAFMIGNEGNGLKKETADMADELILIPMEGKLESLNAAMAAGILMYEMSRQRRNS